MPSFESFSYLKNPLFNPGKNPGNTPGSIELASNIGVKPEGELNKVTMTRADKAATECPSSSPATESSNFNEFETRLAIDKALSQILKLTVDYGALRNRVTNLCQPLEGKDDTWFSFGKKGTQGEKQLLALQEINQKQIADRDKQLALLQSRLTATQKRFDNENVARLLAEKRLNEVRDGVKESDASVTRTNQEVQTLAVQLDQSQAVIRQLEIELADEKQKPHSLNAPLVVDTGNDTQKPAQVNSGAAAVVSASNPALSAMPAATEWIIKGLDFERGSAEIKVESAINLNNLLEYLKQNETLHIQVNGYTDSIGSFKSNLKLSEARAQAVVDYLQQHGVNLSQMKVLGYGERRPVADNLIEAGRIQNRRVAIMFLN